MLVDLIDAVAGDGKELNIDIIGFLPDVENNATARSLILDVIKKDLQKVTETQRDINTRMKKIAKRKA
jgi:hypothetical protein